MARKAFTMKAAAAALVAVLSVGGIAAAATGLLPDQASPVADQAAATTAAGAAAHGLGRAAVANGGGTAQPGSSDGQGRESAVGPDATAAARAGLCQAWESGQGDDQWTSDGLGGVPGVGGGRGWGWQGRRLLQGR